MQEKPTLKSVCQFQTAVQDDKINNSINESDIFSKNQASISKVYLNPNYSTRNSKIYLNPYAKNKPSIHVNPKLLTYSFSHHYNQEKSTKITNDYNQDIDQNTIEEKPLVYVNRKLMTKLIDKVPEDYPDDHILSNLATTFVSSNIFIHRHKLSCKCRLDLIEMHTKDKLNNSILITKTHLNEHVSTGLISSNQTENNRKLDKIYNNRQTIDNSIFNFNSEKNSETVVKCSDLIGRSIMTKKSIIPLDKPIAISTYAVSEQNVVGSKISTVLKEKPSSCLKKSKYKLDTTGMRLQQKYNVRNNTNWKNKVNNIVFVTPHKRITSKIRAVNCRGLVSIGGIMYTKSRNQLIRQDLNTHIKRERNSTSYKNTQYSIDKYKDNTSILNSSQTTVNILLKNNLVTISNKNFKTNASYKVKQKSLQILRNKMRKNNQPCLLFQKFGYCANQINDVCLKVHDKNQVSLCKNFLQGKCISNDCLLSHNIGPEKMPTCKYFLEGCCARDECPYLHVKVSSKSPICVEFLRGYCSQGHDCQKRHIYTCPEFEKTSKCSKNEFCPYPHKVCTTGKKIMKKYVNPKPNIDLKDLNESKDTDHQIFECRKRYYEDLKETALKLPSTNSNAEQWNQSKRKISDDKKNMDIDEHIGQSSDCSINSDNLYNRVERSQIGPLPSYIPINQL